MKLRKWRAACAAALLLCTLSGCQLARPDMQAQSPETDRLVGVLITPEYLDLFDMEGYLNDNLQGLSSGGLIAEGDRSGYEGRLYATRGTKTLTDAETGEQTQVEDLFFEGVEGYACMAPTLPRSGQEDSVVTFISDDAITATDMKVSGHDGGSSISMEATLYVTPGREVVAFYFNPVYQDGEGKVYAQSGSGMSMGGETGEGMSFWHTLTEETTVTENGETQTEGTEIKAGISVMSPPEQVVLVQLDGESGVLSRTSYRPELLPEKISLLADTACLLTERHSAAGITYAVYSPEDTGLEEFYAREDGLCIRRYSTLAWGG